MKSDLIRSRTVALAGKRVMVIGASGFLGTPIVRRLVERGATVLAVSRSVRPGQGPLLKWRPLDATQLPVLLAEMSAFKPHIVYHLTSDSHGGREVELLPDSIRNDVVATVNTLTAAVQCGVESVVMTGSLEEPSPEEPWPTPVSPYAAAKWTVAAYGRMFRKLYDLDVRIARPMMTYGPGQKDYKLIPATILTLLRGEEMRIGSGNRLVDWIYVDDMADAMVGMADPVKSFGYASVDLGSGQLRSVAEVTRIIADQLGLGHRLRISHGARGEEVVRAADVDAARAVLGHVVARTTLDVGIARTISWYEERLRKSEHGSLSGRGDQNKSQISTLHPSGL